jgi:hypothetical protein
MAHGSDTTPFIFAASQLQNDVRYSESIFLIIYDKSAVHTHCPGYDPPDISSNSVKSPLFDTNRLKF